jgi:D-methionine transport system permease protein
MNEQLNEWLVGVIPNVMNKLDTFWQAIIDTLVMEGWSGSISFVLGLLLGVAVVVSRPGGIMQNAVVYQVVDKVVSLFRSIPFIILLTLLLPLTRIIMGTAIGVEGAIVPLVFGCTPFFARQVESALSQVDHGLVEAALSMGNSPLRVVWSVYLRESIPSIARGATITAISLLSLTAMAGVVGAGGLGNFAVMYGHDRNMVDVTWVSVIVLVIMVGIIQAVGNLIARKATH